MRGILLSHFWVNEALLNQDLLAIKYIPCKAISQSILRIMSAGLMLRRIFKGARELIFARRVLKIAS